MAQNESRLELIGRNTINIERKKWKAFEWKIQEDQIRLQQS